MPYVHQKTWVQLAPKIQNLSLRESPWGFGRSKGLGQVTPYYGEVNPGTTIDMGDGTTTSVDLGDTTLSPVPTIGGSSTLTGWLQANQGTVLLLGAGLFGLALISGLAGKR